MIAYSTEIVIDKLGNNPEVRRKMSKFIIPSRNLVWSDWLDFVQELKCLEFTAVELMKKLYGREPYRRGDWFFTKASKFEN